MSLFKTPTPSYREQPDNGTTPQPAGPLHWLSRLLRTPTPTYRSRPTQSAHALELDRPEYADQ